MRMLKSTVIAAIAALLVCGAWAGETGTLLKRVSSSTTIKPGYWYKNFNKAKEYADTAGIPFIAIWSNGDACPHCVNLEKGLNTTTFKNWEVKSGIVFWFGCPDNGYKIDNPEAPFQWTRGGNGLQSYTKGDAPLSAFPFVRVWWKKGKVDMIKAGDDIRGGFTTGAGDSAKKMIANFEKWLKAYTPPTTIKYTGGEFGFNNVPGDRLEAETGLTTNVTVYLTRTNTTAQSAISTNYLVVASSAGTVTNTIDWAAGDKAVEFSLAVDKDGTGDYDLTLLDSAMKSVGTSKVTRVAASNSPDNPKFVGAESENLGFGEWSMDLDAVTNLVANANKGGGFGVASSSKAQALVLFGGSLWCKDCAKTDKYFFSTQEFKDWAKAKKIALGVVDIPNLPNETTSPCLLTKISAVNDQTKDYYKVTGLARSCGIGYLSRHMVDDAAARAVYDRNKLLASNNTLAGGWNRPERPNQNRPGVPILVLLREDGSIAGRFQTFATTSPGDTSDTGSYLARLDELLAQDSDMEEETNDSWYTTARELGKREEIEGTLSCVDAADSYKLSDETKGLKLSISARGTYDANVKLELVRVSGLGSSIITNATGSLMAGVVLPPVDLPAALDCYVTVSTVEGSSYFSAASKISTVAPYTIATDFVIVPAMVKSTTESSDNIVTVEVTEGEAYTFEGATAATLANYFDLSEKVTSASEPIYVAKQSGGALLELEGTSLVHRHWVPGTVGFALSSATVSEAGRTYSIEAVRTGGVSGTASMTVTYSSVQPALDTASIFTDEWNSMTTGETFEWGEGEDDARFLPITIVENDFADGTVRVTFSSSVGGDAAEGVKTFVLSVKDNDKAVPGKLAITDIEPSFSKTMTLVAKENSTVRFGIERQEGSDQNFAASLSTTAGTLDKMAFEWLKRDKTTKEVQLTLPAASAKKAVVTLAAATTATKLVANAKKLTVQIVPSGAPEFEVASAAIAGFRNVRLAEKRIKVNGADASKLKVTKPTGSLPDGLSWKFDSETSELVIYGVPKKAMSSTAVFQASEGSTAGLTVSVSTTVYDLAKDATDGESVIVAANAYAASTHTFSDMLVLDEDEKKLTGLVTLTIPASGKASAKYRNAEGTVSLASKCWDEDSDPATGLLKTTLTGTTKGTAGYTLEVSIAQNGDIDLVFTDPEYNEIPVFSLGNVWTKESPAEAYKGYYTASLPGVASINPAKNQTEIAEGKPVALGDGYITLKMNVQSAINAGKFTYAGVLPDGKAFSGSAELEGFWHDELETYYWGALPVFTAAGADSLAGVILIRPYADSEYAEGDCGEGKKCGYKRVRRSIFAYDGAMPYWTHTESKSAQPEDDENDETASYAVRMDAMGGLYVATENFQELCASKLGTSKLAFYALGDCLADTKYGSFKSWATNTTAFTVAYTAKTKANAMTLAKTSNAYGLTLSFTPSTGVVTGQFKLPMDGGSVKAEYKAIVMPGWGTSECGDGCGIADDDIFRPFLSGAAWFNDDATFFVPSTGRTKKKKLEVRRSCPVSGGTTSGQ